MNRQRLRIHLYRKGIKKRHAKKRHRRKKGTVRKYQGFTPKRKKKDF
ncbi:hypothetical protein [Paenibacillus lutimineralis]|nr:hypothetical protein [Paenibacillus lutimineralis]